MAGSTVFFKTISVIEEKEKLQELFWTKGDYIQHCPSGVLYWRKENAGKDIIRPTDKTGIQTRLNTML